MIGASRTPPVIGLVIATYGRDHELTRLLNSVARQPYRHVVVCVVDQNPDDRVKRALRQNRYEFPIQVIHTSPPGLSRARNQGIRELAADIIGFPDDDCEFTHGALSRIAAFFTEHPEFACLSGRLTSSDGGKPLGRWDNAGGEINRFNVWRRAVSATLYIRSSFLGNLGGFDEEIGVGVGTRWGSGEETDLLLRLMRVHGRAWYDPGLRIDHPTNGQRDQAHKAFAYGMGMGHVLRSHSYPSWFALRAVARPVGGAMVAASRLDGPRVRYQLGMAAGRLIGWLGR